MTKAQWEKQVLDQIAEHGGFSIFWATDNRFIALAIERLARAGKIIQTKRGEYPWCPYTIHA